jgi:hypothetical protein
VPSIDLVTNPSGSAATSGTLLYWLANASSGDTIQFAANLSGHTIYTLGQSLDIGKNLTIDGAALGITVDSGGLNTAVVIEPNKVVAINGLTLTGGSKSGITNLGSLALSNSTVAGNYASSGGGIYNANTGTMTMSRDTVCNNTATDGGGVFNDGQLTIINCTIAANNANQGGGIFDNGVLKIANSTVASNTVTGAGADGGGIYRGFGAGSHLSLLDTIVFNPNSGAGTSDDVFRPIAQAQGSLFGSTVSFDPGGDLGGNQFNANPKLGPLQNNAGPTATMALLPGSPAIGAGVSTSLIPGLSVSASDQRGDPRTTSGIDVGAFQTTLTPHQQYVQALYTDFLHRTGDLSNPGDAGCWVTALDQGTPAATVANQIARSAEALGVDVDGLYHRFLGRDADPAGRAGFVNYLQTGGTLEGVSAMMLASPEYQSHFQTDSDFVQSLYQNLLQRTPDPSEVNAYLTLLPQRGRAGVAQGFLSSAEYRGDEVGNDYSQLLHRSPSPAEVNGWVVSNLDLLSIDAFFAASQEFQSNV